MYSADVDLKKSCIAMQQATVHRPLDWLLAQIGPCNLRQTGDLALADSGAFARSLDKISIDARRVETQSRDSRMGCLFIRSSRAIDCLIPGVYHSVRVRVERQRIIYNTDLLFLIRRA